MKTLSKAAAKLHSGYHGLIARVAREERGDQFVSWILVILAVIAIAAVVVGAMNGWFQGKVGELGS